MFNGAGEYRWPFDPLAGVIGVMGKPLAGVLAKGLPPKDPL